MTSLVILTHLGPIYPPTFGAARRIWGLAKHLRSDDFNVSILTTGNMSNQKVVDGVRIIETPPAIPLPSRFRNRIGQVLARGSATVKFVTFYVNPYHLAVLGKMAASGDLDLVQLEFPYLLPDASLSKLSGFPLVLDEHGVEVDFIRELASSRGVKTSKADLLRVFLIESLAVRLSSGILCCSEKDLERISSIYGGCEGKCTVVENGVDESFFEPVKPYPFRKPTILYVGSYDHAPNRYAMSWIIRQILPRVRRHVPDVQVAFVGSANWTTPPELGQGLEFVNVPDIRPFIRGADVALATVFHGSGTRIKTVEYLACGAPVVSTRRGVEGYNLKPETDLILADDEEIVAASIVDLLESPAKAREMGAQGQKTVREKYTWKVVVSKSRQMFERLAE